MKTIHLHRIGDGLLRPVTEGDRILMQHFMNEDLAAINNNGLTKLRFVAELHGVAVFIDGKPA